MQKLYKKNKQKLYKIQIKIMNRFNKKNKKKSYKMMKIIKIKMMHR